MNPQQYVNNATRSDLATPLLHGTLLLIVLTANWQAFLPPEFHIGTEIFLWGLLGLAGFRIAKILIKSFTSYKRYMRAVLPTTSHGSGGFLSKKDAETAGYYKKSDFFIGILHGRPAYTHMPSNIMICAPARSGKSLCSIMPNLGMNKTSALVTDFKGELFESTHRWRAQKFGHKIIALNMPDRVGAEPASYNVCQIVLDSIAAQPDRALSDARAIASQLVPEPKEGHREPYWPQGAKDVLTTAIIGLAILEPEKCNLVEVRKLVTDRLIFVALCETLQETDALGGDVSVLAGSFMSMEAKTPKELASFCNGAAQAVSVFSGSSRIGKISQSCSFRFRDLKDTPLTIYMGADATNPDEISKAIALWVWAGSVELIREGTASPVMIYADEAARFKINGLADILEGCAGYGLRWILVLQSLGSLEQIYGRDGAARIIGQCHSMAFFGINEIQEAEKISKTLGRITQKVGSYRMGGELGETISSQAKDLLSPDEVRRLQRELMIFISSGERAGLFEKVGSHEIEPLRSGFDPNSLYSPKRFKGRIRMRVDSRGGRVVGPSIKTDTKQPQLPWRKLINRFVAHMFKLFEASKPATIVLLAIAICTLSVGFPYLRYEKNPYRCSYIGVGFVEKSGADCPVIVFEDLPSAHYVIHQTKAVF